MYPDSGLLITGTIFNILVRIQTIYEGSGRQKRVLVFIENSKFKVFQTVDELGLDEEQRKENFILFERYSLQLKEINNTSGMQEYIETVLYECIQKKTTTKQKPSVIRTWFLLLIN